MSLLRQHVALAVAFAAVLAAAVAIVIPWGGQPPAARTVTLGGPARATVTLGDQAQEQLSGIQDAPAAQVHEDLRTEPPAASSPSTRERNAAIAPLGQAKIPAHPPLAAAHVAGCQTRLVRNYSSRGGAPVLLGVIHYTASPPTLGWAGVAANTAWFDTAAAEASSNEIMSRDGDCNLVVPEYERAWTQAGFNSWSVSVEVVTDGTPATFMTGAGDRALSRLVVGWHRRWRIPLRRGAVSGCRVTRTGIVDHDQLGACGGGHVDISPYDVDHVIALALAYLARRSTSPPLTVVETRIQRGIIQPAHTGHSRRYWCQRNRTQRATIRRLARRRHHGWDREHRDARYQRLGHRYTASC